MSVVHESSIYT